MAPREVFAALGDPTRLDLVARLARRGPATATELAGELPMTRQAVSKHLDTLYGAGLVDRAKHGREVRYTFVAGPLGDAAAWLADVGSAWDDRIARLRDALD